MVSELSGTLCLSPTLKTSFFPISIHFLFEATASPTVQNQPLCLELVQMVERPFSRMSRGGSYGMTDADWLISPRAAQLLPGIPLLFKRAGKESMPRGSVSLMFTKIKETGRDRYWILFKILLLFCKSRDS